MKAPAKPRILFAGLCLLLHGQVLASAYVDEQNRLVVNGLIISPPSVALDAAGNIFLDGQFIPMPDATVLEDGSLLLDGVVFPIPPLPIEGAASYAEWLTLVFPDPADRENPGLAGAMADPGNRGVPNLIRYVLAMHTPNQVFEHLPRAAMSEGRLSLSFPFIGVRADVRVEVVAGSNLTDWSEVLWDSLVDGLASEPGTWVRVDDLVLAEAAGEKRFLRLRVSQPPAD